MTVAIENLDLYNSDQNPCWSMEFFLTSSLVNLIKKRVEGYGITFMETGFPLSDGRVPMNLNQLYRDIIENLRYNHSKNVYHCDIRRNNVMYFPHLKKFQLINYDLSTIGDDDIKVQQDSGQHRAAPFFVRENNSLYSIKWGATEDLSMFFEWFLKVIKRENV